MAKVMTGATMSLDGYISGPNESGFDRLFRWYFNGDVETPTANPEQTPRTSAASAGHLRELNESTGLLWSVAPFTSTPTPGARVVRQRA